MAHFDLVEKPTPVHEKIPLFNLRPSPRNVRTVKKPVDDLVASIKAHGLLKNLVVVPAADGNGYEVVAGDRRHRALQQLEAEGFPPNLIMCLVLPEGASEEEISLAENVEHEPMHPVDEFLAYQRLVDDGMTVEDLVVHFGKSQLYIEQRLKLASVSPKILEQFKADEISLAQVIALTVTSDQKAQEKVWAAAQKGSEWSREPERLRELLMEKELQVGEDAVATYLGVKDYEAGGGQANRDLFSDMVWLPDAKLARALAKEKLDKAAKKIRKEGWNWVEVRLEFPYSEEMKFSRPYGYRGGANGWSAEAKEICGAVLSIGHDGKVDVERGLARPADLKKAATTSSSKEVKKAAGKAKPARKPGQLSWAQTQLLQAERDAVLRDELASNQRIALAALAARLADEVGILKSTALDEVVKFSKGSLSSDRLPIIARPVVEKSAAAARLREKAKAWKGKVPKGSSTLEYLLSQPEAVTHELLTLCAAHSMVSMPWHDGMQDAGQKLAQIAGIDMASHWTPTAEWLERQPTAYITEAVTQARGKVAAAELRKAKGKKAVAKKAAELLAPVPGKAPWLPAPLRAPVVKAKPKKPRKTGKGAAAEPAEAG